MPHTHNIIGFYILDVPLLCSRRAAAVQELANCFDGSPDGGGHEPLAAEQPVADGRADTTGEPRRAQDALPREY
jgi:hypothetical protein